MTELFEAAFRAPAGGFAGLALQLTLNLISTFIIVRLVYHRLYHNRDYVFTYLLLNIVTFSLAFLMSKVSVQLGLALGLFGVFGILRYRTEAIQVRDLTYLFVVIGLALANALSSGDRVTVAELLTVNVVIVGAVCLLEAAAFSSREESRQILYDRLDLLGPSTSQELLQDLRARTHLPVDHVEIGNVDLLRDTANIVVYYRVPTRRKGAALNETRSTSASKPLTSP